MPPLSSTPYPSLFLGLRPLNLQAGFYRTRRGLLDRAQLPRTKKRENLPLCLIPQYNQSNSLEGSKRSGIFISAALKRGNHHRRNLRIPGKPRRGFLSRSVIPFARMDSDVDTTRVAYTGSKIDSEPSSKFKAAA